MRLFTLTVLAAFVLALIADGSQQAKTDSKGPVAKREVVEAIFAELIVLPAQSKGETFDPRKLAEENSFPAAAMKGLILSPGATFDEIQREPKKYARMFPLRVAVVEAFLILRKSAKDLPVEFSNPISESIKHDIERKHQRVIAEMQRELEEIDARLTDVGKNRKRDRPDRWLAHYDYVTALVKLRIAWCGEYNLSLARARADQLPELDPKLNQYGWRLVPAEKMSSPKEIRDLAADAKQALGQLEKSFPDTPWAFVGSKQKDQLTGLQWQAATVAKKK